MTLYVVRHGETDWNHERRLQGRLDVPLNGIGLAQARALARYFEDHRVARVLTSPLRRALATAATIAQAANCPLEIANELSEIHHGIWQGLTVDEIQARYPDLWTIWNARPSQAQPAGAESLSEVRERVDRLLQRLATNDDICLVTHGVVSQAIVVRLMGLDLDALFTVTQANGCINVFEIVDAEAFPKTLNFTAHLQAGPSDQGVKTHCRHVDQGEP